MPELIDRRALLAGTGAALLASGAGLAQQPWPQGRQVKLVVPFTPGGATDVLGRLAADKLSQSWGNVVVVENRPGAGSNIGIEAVAKAEPNGDTLLIASVGLATNRYLYAKVNYDPVRDLAPITMVALVPNLLVVRNDLPVRNVAELVAYAKANPGKLTFGAGSSSSRIAGEMLKSLAGLDITYVPYRSNPQAITDLLGGQINIVFADISTTLPQIKAGAVNGLAVSTARRSVLAPDLPTMAEGGVKGYDLAAWFAAFVPAKTPRSTIDKLNQALTAAVNDPATKERLLAAGVEPETSTPDELKAFVGTEIAKWAEIVKAAGIQPE